MAFSFQIPVSIVKLSLVSRSEFNQIYNALYVLVRLSLNKWMQCMEYLIERILNVESKFELKNIQLTLNLLGTKLLHRRQPKSEMPFPTSLPESLQQQQNM